MQDTQVKNKTERALFYFIVFLTLKDLVDIFLELK